MAQYFTNMDALWLQQLAELFSQGIRPDDQEGDAIAASRLLAIATNLQSLDDKVQTLQSLPTTKGTYAEGYAAAEARMRRRSNILDNPEGEDEVGAAIINQINTFEAQGKIKKAAMGERGLEDKPHMFNAPIRKKPLVKKTELDIKLDLSGLDF